MDYSLDFEGQETATILLGGIKELEELFKTFDGISEEKLISWLMGSKRNWIAHSEIQSSINSS